MPFLERRCGRHLPFMEVADAICLLRTPFAICGRHLPFVDATCQFREGADAICLF